MHAGTLVARLLTDPGATLQIPKYVGSIVMLRNANSLSSTERFVVHFFFTVHLFEIGVRCQ